MKKTKNKSQARRPEFPLFGFLMSALLPTLGIALFFFPTHGYQSYQVHSQASGWPKTNGTVIQSQLITRKGMGTEEDMYRADIRVQYQLEGKNYIMDGLYIGDTESWCGNQYAVRQRVSEYPPGRQLQLSYSPDQPSVAVVETGIQLTCIMLFLLMVMLILLGGWLLLLSLRDIYRLLRSFFAKR